MISKNFPEVKFGIYLIQENDFKITQLILDSGKYTYAIYENHSNSSKKCVFSKHVFISILRSDPDLIVFNGVEKLEIKHAIQAFESGITVILLNSNFNEEDFYDFKNETKYNKVVDLNRFIIKNKLVNF